jgi:hypothetical protein
MPPFSDFRQAATNSWSDSFSSLTSIRIFLFIVYTSSGIVYIHKKIRDKSFDIPEQIALFPVSALAMIALPLSLS